MVKFFFNVEKYLYAGNVYKWGVIGIQYRWQEFDKQLNGFLEEIWSSWINLIINNSSRLTWKKYSKNLHKVNKKYS